MAVVSHRLHIAQKCHQKTHQNAQQFDGGCQGRLVSQYQSDFLRIGIAFAADQHSDERTQGYGGCCKKSGGHDVVTQRLHCQNSILQSIRHDGANPDLSVNLVDADDGGSREFPDAVDELGMIEDEKQQAKGNKNHIEVSMVPSFRHS